MSAGYDLSVYQSCMVKAILFVLIIGRYIIFQFLDYFGSVSKLLFLTCVDREISFLWFHNTIIDDKFKPCVRFGKFLKPILQNAVT